MRIVVTSSDPDVEPEVFESLHEVEVELDLNAESGYADVVLKQLRDGEKIFTIKNGVDTETWEVVD